MADSESKICFEATLQRPVAEGKPETWTFLRLPLEASKQLPSRGMNSVEGTFNGTPFQATLEPDGQGGHWMKVEEQLREAGSASAGDLVILEFALMAQEPEPKVPEDLRLALSAVPEAQARWLKITAIARRDWIQWIDSAKRPETRIKRIVGTCDRLLAGKRNICCFDRSGKFSKGFSCPVAEQ